MSEPKRDAAGTPHPSFDTEIDSRAIGMFGVYLTVGVVVVAILMWALFRDFKMREEAADLPGSPLADHSRPHLPPEPRLQTTPELDLQAYLAAERQRVAGYGWVDEKAGLVHVPVDRAIDLVLERGFPAPSATQPEGAAQQVTPGAAATGPGTAARVSPHGGR
jgi:hypothetical protein